MTYVCLTLLLDEIDFILAGSNPIGTYPLGGFFIATLDPSKIAKYIKYN